MSEELQKRWNISARTLQNWRGLGERVGQEPPLEATDPGELLDWYRRHVGREPNGRVKEAARAMRAEMEVVGRQVEVPMGPVEAVAAACDLLGLSRTLARLVEEDERAWATYEAARADGLGGEESARRAWRDITEAKRAAQKSEDAVAVALELLKAWVRAEWEPVERAMRSRLAGKETGLEARAELLAAVTEGDWVRAWDRAVERAMAGGKK